MNLKFSYAVFLVVALFGVVSPETANGTVANATLVTIVDDNFENVTFVPKKTYKEVEKEIRDFVNSTLVKFVNNNFENLTAKQTYKDVEKEITDFVNSTPVQFAGDHFKNVTAVPKQTYKDAEKQISDFINSTTVQFVDDNFENVTAVPKQTYKEAEKEITDFVNSILKSLLPQIVGGSGGAKLTPRCIAGMMKIFGFIRRMKGWTLKMLDSMGKPSSGILKGTSYSMGNYDECLDLAVTSKGAETTDAKDEMFRGKYCRVRITFPEIIIETARSYHKGLVNASDLGKLKDVIQSIPYIPVTSNYMNHFLGMCFPSSCTMEDLNELVKLNLKDLCRAQIRQCYIIDTPCMFTFCHQKEVSREMTYTEIIPFPGSAKVDRCEVKTDSELDNTQLTVICIFLMLVLLAILSTCVDWILHRKKTDKSVDPCRDKKCVSVSIAFSFCNNTKKLMKNIEDDGEGLLAGQSVRGIAVASVAWIILGYTYLYPHEGYFFQMSSLSNLRNYWDEGYFSMIMSFPLAIDALFVCYGFLFTFSLWQPTLKSRDVTINVISLIVKNYIRLCLPLLFCFGVIVLLPLIGSGPFWGDLLDKSIDNCRENAGAHFGMYNNFLNIDEQCFPHMWFVSCLAQLTLIGIFLSWILSRNMKVGVLITLLICIFFNGAVGIITFNNNFPPSYVAYFAEETSNLFWKINMSLPLSHFGSYAAGMLAGILVAKGDHHRARKCLCVVGWIACLGILYAIQLVLYKSRDGNFNPVSSAIFASIHRTAFGACVSWIIVACSYGIGGFVNAIFSWRIFDPLFRLSYYAYLFHFIVISFTVSIAKEHFPYNHIELILRASSYIAATYFIVYFFYMLLEMPLGSLRVALCSKKTCQLEVTTLNNFPMHKGDIISKNAMEGPCKLWSITESHNSL